MAGFSNLDFSAYVNDVSRKGEYSRFEIDMSLAFQMYNTNNESTSLKYFCEPKDSHSITLCYESIT